MGAASPFKPLAIRVKEFEKPSKHVTAAKASATLTNPKSPMLRTRLRGKQPLPESTETAEVKKITAHDAFKAKPAPTMVFYLLTQKNTRVRGVPKAVGHSLTIPHSPAITKPKPKTAAPIDPVPCFKANPVPSTVPFVPALPERSAVTTLDAPDLPGDAISQYKRKEFCQRLEETNREAAALRQFTARPVPRETAPPLPPPAQHKTTVVHEFDLATRQRGDRAAIAFAEKQRKQEQDSIAAHEFKATDIKSGDVPFYPVKSDKPPTLAKEIVMHSTVRADERREFDQGVRERILEAEAEQREFEERQRIEEEEEVRRMRREMVHTAGPVRHFKDVKVVESEKSLTQAVSPMIGRKRE